MKEIENSIYKSYITACKYRICLTVKYFRVPLDTIQYRYLQLSTDS
jgi:hypothetical protein